MKLNWKDYTTYNPNNFTGWRAARETGYIYFIRCNQYIKIGKTSNLYQRVHSLQGSNPHELKLVGIYASASLTVDEKFFHNEVKKIANKNNLKIHMDGARLFNASIAQNESIENIVKKLDLKHQF